MKNDGIRTEIKTCLKTVRRVEVVEELAADGQWFVQQCRAKSDRCVGVGCFLAEMGGGWPFAESE